MTPRLFALTAIAAALAACSSIPDRNLALDQARIGYNSLQTESVVSRHAGEELKTAGDALRLAEQAHAEGAVPAQVDHLAYLTQQRIAIARETASGRAAQAVTAGAAAERDRMRLALRTQEADSAQMKLAASESDGARKSAALAQSERDSARKSQDLAQAERDSARKSADLAQAERTAEADKARLERRDASMLDLRAQLAELNARSTERGIIVTLGDVLFDSGQSRLQREGGGLSKLADFMKRYPLRQASIEGYTDSIGSTTSNQDLSDRRAHAVMAALVGMGIPGRPAQRAGLWRGSAGGQQRHRGRQADEPARRGDLRDPARRPAAQAVAAGRRDGGAKRRARVSAPVRRRCFSPRRLRQCRTRSTPRGPAPPGCRT